MAQGRNNTRYRYLTLRNEYGALGKVYRTAFPGFGTGGGALQENLRARTSLEASRRRFRFSKLLLRLQTSLPPFSLLFSSAFAIRSLVHLYQACSKRRAMACSPATQGTRRTAYMLLPHRENFHIKPRAPFLEPHFHTLISVFASTVGRHGYLS